MEFFLKKDLFFLNYLNFLNKDYYYKEEISLYRNKNKQKKIEDSIIIKETKKLNKKENIEEVKDNKEEKIQEIIVERMDLDQFILSNLSFLITYTILLSIEINLLEVF